MTFSHRKTVLFDLDGTVVDSARGILNALRYTFERIGLPPEEEEALHRFIGPSIGATLIQKYGLTPKEAANSVSVYREYYARQGQYECQVYAGIPSLLQKLQEQGKHLGIATKKPEIFAEEIIRHLGLSQYVDTVCGADLNDHEDQKSHIIKTALVRLNAAAEDSVMVGDTQYDVIGAKEVGVDCIGVLYGFGDRASLTRYGAAVIADDVQALNRLLL